MHILFKLKQLRTPVLEGVIIELSVGLFNTVSSIFKKAFK